MDHLHDVAKNFPILLQIINGRLDGHDKVLAAHDARLGNLEDLARLANLHAGTESESRGLTNSTVAENAKRTVNLRSSPPPPRSSPPTVGGEERGGGGEDLFSRVRLRLRDADIEAGAEDSTPEKRRIVSALLKTVLQDEQFLRTVLAVVKEELREGRGSELTVTEEEDVLY